MAVFWGFFLATRPQPQAFLILFSSWVILQFFFFFNSLCQRKPLLSAWEMLIHFFKILIAHIFIISHGFMNWAMQYLFRAFFFCLPKTATDYYATTREALSLIIALPVFRTFLTLAHTVLVCTLTGIHTKHLSLSFHCFFSSKNGLIPFLDYCLCWMFFLVQISIGKFSFWKLWI